MKLTESQHGIIKAGFVIFSEFGKVKASMAQIAKVAKVSKPLLFHHFGNKEKLYKTCQQFAHGQLADLKKSFNPKAPYLQILKDIQVAKFNLEKTYPGIFKFVLLEQTQLPHLPPTPFSALDRQRLHPKVNPDQFWRILYFLALGYQAALQKNKETDTLIQDYQASFAMLEQLVVSKEE